MVLQTIVPIVVSLLLYFVILDADLEEMIPKLTMYALVGYRLLPSVNKISDAVSILRKNKVIIENI